MCGDKIHLTLECAGGQIQQAAFKAYGCAPTLALGSLLTELVTERSVTELAKIDAVEFNTLLGGLKPSQKHVASLGCRLLAELVSRDELLG